jgi:integrase
MTRDVAIRLVQAAEVDSIIGSYLILSVMTGIRPEEARALLWDHVDLDGATIHVWRSTRAHGNVKPVKSRRTLEIAPQAVEALRRRQTQEERDRVQARELWHVTGLVFTTSSGTEMDSHNIRRSMRRLTKAAGLGESWTPRELRHTFVSIAKMSNVAFSASFGHLREHALPAAQRTAPRRSQRDGAWRSPHDLGCQQPVATGARMRYLIRLQQVTVCCGRGNVQKRSEGRSSIRPIAG